MKRREEAAAPGFVPPMLAKRVNRLPEGPQWSYETKWDGYRVEAIKSGSHVRLLSRRGSNFTKRFAPVTEAVIKLQTDSLVLDGEVVALDESGRPSFQALQNRRRGTKITFFAFDLLHLNGHDLKALPLKDRRKQLETVLKNSEVRLSESLPGTPAQITRAVAEHGLEGVVAKRKDSIYEPGQRSGVWQKLPLKKSRDFVIGGFRPEGTGLDALLVGFFEGRDFVFAGKVRAGLNPSTRTALGKGLKPLAVKTCPFKNLPSSKTGHWGEGVSAEEMGEYVWLEPIVIAEIKFTEWTAGDVLRHPEFVGIREDKQADEVKRES